MSDILFPVSIDKKNTLNLRLKIGVGNNISSNGKTIIWIIRLSVTLSYASHDYTSKPFANYCNYTREVIILLAVL